MTTLQERSQLSVSVICGDHSRSELICVDLAEKGLDARSGDFHAAADVVLFDLTTCSPSLVDEMLGGFLELGAERPLLATLGRFDRTTAIPSQIDVRLSSDAALSLAASRFRFARRIMARTMEAELRQESFARFGVENSETEDDSTLPFLFVGDVGKSFLALQPEITGRGRELIAAFSTYSAFDYLHDAAFDGIVVDGASKHIRLDHFCDMVARSPGLTDIPLLVLTEDEANLPDQVLRRASDLMSRDAPARMISDQLLHLARFQTPQRARFAPPSAAITDDDTGLFARPFFENHLSLQVDWAHRCEQPLSIVVIKVVVDDADSEGLRTDISNTARTARTLLRAQDAPCRLTHDTIAISLPGADHAEAATAAQRLCDVMDATAFEDGLDTPSRQVLIKCRIATLEQNMSADAFLNAAEALSQSDQDRAA